MNRYDEPELPVFFESKAHEALISVWWTGVLLKKEAKRFFRSSLNSDAQFNILMILKYSDTPQTQNDLSQKLLVDKSNITGLVDRMEQMDLIRRNAVAGDRRSYHITLTDKGRAIIDELDTKYEVRVGRIMAEFTPEENQQLINLTAKLRRGLMNARE